MKSMSAIKAPSHQFKCSLLLRAKIENQHMTPHRVLAAHSNSDTCKMVLRKLTSPTLPSWATSIPNRSSQSKRKYSACPCSSMSILACWWEVWLIRIRKSRWSKSLSFWLWLLQSKTILPCTKLRHSRPTMLGNQRIIQPKAYLIQILCQ